MTNQADAKSSVISHSSREKQETKKKEKKKKKKEKKKKVSSNLNLNAWPPDCLGACFCRLKLILYQQFIF
jgi:hypothetical protein